MPIFWHVGTREDFQAIRQFYHDHPPEAVTALIKAVFEAARRLEAHPQLGRAGRVAGTRELPVPGTKFLLAYQVTETRIIVLCVYHSSRQWPAAWLSAAAKGGEAGTVSPSAPEDLT